MKRKVMIAHITVIGDNVSLVLMDYKFKIGNTLFGNTMKWAVDLKATQASNLFLLDELTDTICYSFKDHEEYITRGLNEASKS